MRRCCAVDPSACLTGRQAARLDVSKEPADEFEGCAHHQVGREARHEARVDQQVADLGLCELVRVQVLVAQCIALSVLHDEEERNREDDCDDPESEAVTRIADVAPHGHPQDQPDRHCDQDQAHVDVVAQRLVVLQVVEWQCMPHANHPLVRYPETFWHKVNISTYCY